MVTIDRMTLDDTVGGNPIKIADEIFRQNPDITFPVPLEEIAKAAGILSIEYREMEGCEGMLVTDEHKQEGMIAVRKHSLEARMRFTLGHELGHFLNPWHKKPNGQFQCIADDMGKAEDKTKGDDYRMESEANAFAAEILMPRKELIKDMRRLKSPDIDHITALSVKYGTSKDALARRYVEFQDDAVAIVFSKDNIIRRIYKSKYFPSLNVWLGEKVPSGSTTSKHDGNIGTSSEWMEHPSDMWLSSKKYSTVEEQALKQQEGFKMTLLTLGEQEDEDDEDTERSWKVNYRR